MWGHRSNINRIKENRISRQRKGINFFPFCSRVVSSSGLPTNTDLSPYKETRRFFHSKKEQPDRYTCFESEHFLVQTGTNCCNQEKLAFHFNTWCKHVHSYSWNTVVLRVWTGCLYAAGIETDRFVCRVSIIVTGRGYCESTLYFVQQSQETGNLVTKSRSAYLYLKQPALHSQCGPWLPSLSGSMSLSLMQTLSGPWPAWHVDPPSLSLSTSSVIFVFSYFAQFDRTSHLLLSYLSLYMV